ncbi:hypothetical protein UFOVP1393_3 [uncultured Caudovirales phage]|uniref:Uncharacterized protein n=1 Tax=uncultured Caudovirales phage TaxID=2100421 RepID=A0A6J5S5R1_9CAUD|nr:hypothetical protein UFOVP1393_3 [uncultured Caudovirales phage]
MAKLTKEQLEKQNAQLYKKIDSIDVKLNKLNEPNKIGFVYKNRIV